MPRAVGRIGDSRSCGAVIISSPQSSVFVDNVPIAVLGSLDSHGGRAMSTATGFFIENLPVVLLGDVNDICAWIWPPHFTQPLVTGGQWDLFGD